MLGRRLARPVAAVSVAVLLAGCFPPFLPWDPTLFPPLGNDSVVVHNHSDGDWVVTIESAGPTAFAVPAGASGEMPLWGLQATGVRLLDVECAEVDALQLEDPPAGDPWVLTIGEGGVLSVEAGAPDDELPTLVEFYDCFGAGAVVEPGEPVPGVIGSIVVQGEDGGLWSVNVADGVATVLVAGDPEFLGGGHVLSPDASRVAFSTWDVDGIETAISVADADGANERLLVENGTFPSWSPDGTRIAFLDTDPFAGGSALGVIDADDGGEPRRLAPAASWLAWSPDGTRIAFITDATNDFSSEIPEAGTLSVVDVEDGTITELASTAPYSSMPAWSPDGAQIAFTGGTYDTTDLRVVDADGGEDRVVSDGDGASLAEPAWSPDGSHLAAVAYSLGFVSTTSSIVLVDPIGAEPDRVLVTSTEDTHYTPAWSPDGGWLAYSRSDVDYRSSVVLVDVEAGEETVVAHNVFAIAGWLR